MAKLRGRDVLKPAEIRSQLEDLNAAFGVDGSVDQPEPGSFGVCVFADVDEFGATSAAVEYHDQTAQGVGRCPDPVVYLPGSGKPFPVRAYVEALLCSEVEAR
jgi:hypothetical protein